MSELPVKVPENPPDPAEAENVKSAILVRRRGNSSVAIGDPTREEWIVSTSMVPLSLDDCR